MVGHRFGCWSCSGCLWKAARQWEAVFPGSDDAIAGRFCGFSAASILISPSVRCVGVSVLPPSKHWLLIMWAAMFASLPRCGAYNWQFIENDRLSHAWSKNKIQQLCWHKQCFHNNKEQSAVFMLAAKSNYFFFNKLCKQTDQTIPEALKVVQ